jgi:hypothetical protein
VRSDGTILRNGQPFFPLGFYNLFNRDANGAITEKQSRLDALKIQVDAGFNFLRRVDYTRSTHVPNLLSECIR